MEKTFVIAEAGSNHFGSLTAAISLIVYARKAGADAVKFQYCSNYSEFMRRRKLTVPPYPFSIEKFWLPELRKWADKFGIEFMCSTFIPEDIEVVAPFVNWFKISAYESKDRDFIGMHGRYNKPTIISGITLYCVSEYPCADDRINLSEMWNYQGLSDHTKNPLTGALAVAMGATIVETHFRLDDTPKSCPDFEVARSPSELIQYIQNIRQAETLLGLSQGS